MTKCILSWNRRHGTRHSPGIIRVYWNNHSSALAHVVLDAMDVHEILLQLFFIIHCRQSSHFSLKSKLAMTKVHSPIFSDRNNNNKPQANGNKVMNKKFSDAKKSNTFWFFFMDLLLLRSPNIAECCFVIACRPSGSSNFINSIYFVQWSNFMCTYIYGWNFEPHKL